VAIEVSENGWHCFANAAFSGKFAFPICVNTPSRRLAGTLQETFVYMATTSCMSVAVSNVGAEWLVAGNVLCNVLMACNRCFFI